MISHLPTGAPGTVPLRGLVRKYASVNPELDPNHNTKLVGPLLPHQGMLNIFAFKVRSIPRK